MNEWWNRVHIGSSESMAAIPDASVHCCVTSPPYFGLRDYGVDGQIGLEPTVEEYVGRLVSVFREVRRVLRDDGTLFMNLGDSYASEPGDRFKPKDLIGIPWTVAFALRADGWWLRDAIVWHKPAGMPSAVTDRCTPAYEMVFMLAKRQRYFADMDAVRVPSEWAEHNAKHGETRVAKVVAERRDGDRGRFASDPMGANLRNVWKIASQPYSDAHFATFPNELAARCIMIGSSEAGCCSKCGAPRVRRVLRETVHASGSGRSGNAIGGKYDGESSDGQVRENHDIRHGPTAVVRTLGFDPSCECNAPTIPCTVLDPFMGSGTTAEAAEAIGRRWVGYELNPKYASLVSDRTRQMGLFSA